MASITKFLRETRAEMKHVIWPTKSRAFVYALVVIIFSVALGYLLFGFDQLFQVGLRQILF